MIVEDGTGLSTATSYCSIADADAYHLRRGPGTSWDTATSPTKEQYLQWATRLLDEQCHWAGLPATTTQACGWPRAGCYSRQGVLLVSTGVPPIVADATAELARRLIDEDLSIATESGAVSSKTVGPSSISYATPVGARPVPESVQAMVRHLVLARMAVRA